MRTKLDFVRLANGVTLHILDEGPVTSEPPLVLLHGLSDSLHSYDLVRAHLPTDRRIVAVTLRGHGESNAPLNGYKMRDFADDVMFLLNALNIRRAVIVGHSLGTAIAMQVAASYPSRCAGVVLLAAFADTANSDAVKELAGVVATFPNGAVDEEFVREFQLSTAHLPLPPDFLQLAIAESLKAAPQMWTQTVQGLREIDLPMTAARCQAPVLIVWGDQDAYCPRADQARLCVLMDGARLVVLNGVGHAVHWERPSEVGRQIVGFLADLSARTRALAEA
jgi:pimeloyl-ACP methyl ester carboxylesterase